MKIRSEYKVGPSLGSDGEGSAGAVRLAPTCTIREVGGGGTHSGSARAHRARSPPLCST